MRHAFSRLSRQRSSDRGTCPVQLFGFVFPEGKHSLPHRLNQRNDGVRLLKCCCTEVLGYNVGVAPETFYNSGTNLPAIFCLCRLVLGHGAKLPLMKVECISRVYQVSSFGHFCILLILSVSQGVDGHICEQIIAAGLCLRKRSQTNTGRSLSSSELDPLKDRMIHRRIEKGQLWLSRSG